MTSWRGIRRLLRRRVLNSPYLGVIAPVVRAVTESRPIIFAQAFDRFVKQFAADARFYHGPTRAGRSGAGSLACTMLCNRRLSLLTFHRIHLYGGGLGRWLLRAGAGAILARLLPAQPLRPGRVRHPTRVVGGHRPRSLHPGGKLALPLTRGPL